MARKPKELFQEYCGPKFERFIEKLGVTSSGTVKLRFWQQSLGGEAIPDG